MTFGTICWNSSRSREQPNDTMVFARGKSCAGWRWRAMLSEETQEDVEKIKKKRNKKDDDLRKHTEKDDGRKKRRVLKHSEKRS